MLTIEHCDIEEKIEIGSLFEQIGFHSSTQNTDDSGDSFIPNNWGIEALSLDAYYPIEGYRWTKPEKQIELVVNCDGNNLSLKCSPDHLILARVDMPDPHGVWKSVKELTLGDKIITKFGLHTVIEIREIEEVERLCDLQVGIAHSYYTNDILSHNSHFLTFLGANALRENVDVLHYTFELSESAVGRRYDSNLCDIDSNFVIENKDKVISQYQDMKLGRLIIKEFPTNTASIYTLRNHIERLNIKGFNPGLIIIDYADIMRSTRQYDSLRHELKLIYEELRGFAGEKAIPLWTACFHGDTIIKTPCGDEKISNLVGKSNFPVYSYNHETKRVELRTVKSVYESGKNVAVCKVTLDNGESVIVTPNHKFMKRDGSYCEVQDLKVGDSLMPFNERQSKGTMKGRKEIYRNNGSWEFAYKMVANWKFGSVPKFHQIHHKDFDKKNDHPDNLELLTISEHYKVHSRVMWDPHIPCSMDHLRKVYSERMKINNPMFDLTIRKRAGENRKGKCMGSDNPMKLEENKKKVSKSIKTSNKFAVYVKTAKSKAKAWWDKQSDAEKIKRGQMITAGHYGLSYQDYLNQIDDAKQKCTDIAVNSELRTEYIQKVKNIALDKVSKNLIWKIKNHKVVSIESYGYADVYNMEVDELHNYAIGAGIIVKNSQSNKEGSDSDIVDLSNMSEAYGKAMVADVVISLSRRSHEKSSGHGRLYVAKNRAGKDGIVYPVKIDTSKSKFEITGVVGSFENAVKEGDNDIKKALRTKWRELQNDSVLGSKLQDVANVIDDNSEPKIVV